MPGESPEWLEYILLKPQISAQNIAPFHLVDVQIFHSKSEDFVQRYGESQGITKVILVNLLRNMTIHTLFHFIG